MSASSRNYAPGPIAAGGAFTGEFGLGDGLPMEEAPYVIERDRINEGRLPGFGRKLLPVKLDASSGERTAGGYYLLDSFDQARHMFDWYQDPVDGFVLDGIPILQRSYFLNPRAHYWQVAAAEDFKSIETEQKIVRFQRWRGDASGLENRLLTAWPEMREQARDMGLAALWLLFNPGQEESIALVSVSGSSAHAATDTLDFAGIDALQTAVTPGERIINDKWATSSFDRTSWIFSIWFPYDAGPASKKTLWPNSPPFPGL